MTEFNTTPDVIEDLDRAHKVVCDLASSGCKSWRMSIPADERRDTDLILGRAIRAARDEILRLRSVTATYPLRAHVYAMVDRERRYQDAKFGGRPHEIPSWLMLSRSEIAEAEVAWCRADKDEASSRAEIVQAIAVLVACLEQHGGAEEPKHTAYLADMDEQLAAHERAAALRAT